MRCTVSDGHTLHIVSRLAYLACVDIYMAKTNRCVEQYILSVDCPTKPGCGENTSIYGSPGT